MPGVHPAGRCPGVSTGPYWLLRRSDYGLTAQADAIKAAVREKRPKHIVKSWPDWWAWELELSSHVEKRMGDRDFSEVELRDMLERATG